MKKITKKIFTYLALGSGLYLPLAALAIELPNVIKPTPLGGGTAKPAENLIDVVIGGYLGFAGLIAVFAFGFLVFSGFRMIIAQNNPEALTTAKNGILGSVLGLLAAILSVTIILSASTLLGGNGANELATPNTLKIPIDDKGFLDVFINVMVRIIQLSFIVCVLMVIYAGYRMIASSGNDEQLMAAKTTLRWAVVGILVVGLSYMAIFGLARLFCPSGTGSCAIETKSP